jgi:hypothetical protein
LEIFERLPTNFETEKISEEIVVDRKNKKMSNVSRKSNYIKKTEFNYSKLKKA